MAAIEIRMPEFSGEMSEADLIAWLVKPGDEVREGDLIAEIETDKSTVEFESPASGVVRELAVAEGATVKVGELLAVLEGAAAAAAEREVAEEAGDARPAEPPSPHGSDARRRRRGSSKCPRRAGRGRTTTRRRRGDGRARPRN